VARLRAFRERYPYQTVTIDGTDWRYIDTREGETAIYVAAGGTTVAEVSFNTLEHLAERYRVVAPDYPSLGTLEALFDGTLALMDHLGIDRFVAMGGSYGGWMVQSLVRHCPERVSHMIVAAVGPPNVENGRQIAKMMRWLRFAPTTVLRWLANLAFGRLGSGETEDPDMMLLLALVQEVMKYRVSRADLLAMLERLVDQTHNYTFTAEDLVDWPGDILVLFGAEDPATPPERREETRALYPQAKIVTFEGGGHAVALSHQVQYFAAIDEFLAATE
jgi:pimeloyl-ACP methyl ester carboxylesterase